MSMTFVKKATPFDAPKIYNLICLSYAEIDRELGLPGGVAALKENSWDILKDMEKKHMLVCTKNSDVIGTIRYQVFQGSTGGKIAYISRFCVLPEEQHTGVGSKLLQEVEKQCREKGVDTMVLHTPTKNETLVRFYYKNGFYITSTNDEKGYVRGLFLKSLTDKKTDLSVVEAL